MKQTLLTAPRDPTMQHQNLGKPARITNTHKKGETPRKSSQSPTILGLSGIRRLRKEKKS